MTQPAFQIGDSVRVLEYPKGHKHESLVATVSQILDVPLIGPTYRLWITKEAAEAAGIYEWWEQLYAAHPFLKDADEREPGSSLAREMGAIQITLSQKWVVSHD